MVIHRVFDEIFRSRSFIAVLRSLIDTNTGFTGNEVARVSSMNPRSAFKALTSLENLGIVKRQIGGRDHIFTLNRENYLVNEVIIPLFEQEYKYIKIVSSELARNLKDKVIAAIIFGSTARKEEKPLSDLDICCIVDGKKDIEDVRVILNDSSQMFYERYGVKVSPIFFTSKEFKRKSNTQLVKNIITEGKVIIGSLKRIA